MHACTPQDILSVLELIEADHLAKISLIVLRQPKTKEEILHSVWGRFVYYADQLTKTCILAKDKEQATKLINTLDSLYPNFEANFGKNNNMNTPDQLRQFVKQIQ